MSDSDIQFEYSSSSSSENINVILKDEKQAEVVESQTVFDFDLNTLEEKLWLKPGADITDYFNYGFDESTWKSYCAKQKEIRGFTGAEVFQFKKQDKKTNIDYKNTDTNYKKQNKVDESKNIPARHSENIQKNEYHTQRANEQNKHYHNESGYQKYPKKDVRRYDEDTKYENKRKYDEKRYDKYEDEKRYGYNKRYERERNYEDERRYVLDRKYDQKYERDRKYDRDRKY